MRAEVIDQGLMAIYVDDVLLATKNEVATSALGAIAEVWEYAKPEQASLERPVSFCGFEVQKNDREVGGGFCLHQASYEAELVKMWDVKDVSNQLNFKLPTPEQEAEMVRSEDVEAVHRAQACTGALVCLATRTRPELSLGVAAMSRFCTKSPETTLKIGEKIMEYLKRPTLVLI